MIQRYTYGVIKGDRDSERGEWVRYDDHLLTVKRLLAICRDAVDYLDSAGCHAAARLTERAAQAEGSEA